MAGITDMITNVNTGAILNTVLTITAVIIGIGIVGYLVWFYTKKKKFQQYRIRILDKDSNGKAYEWSDRGGVFLDKKDGIRLLYLEKAKVGLNPNKIPYISTLDKKGRIIKIVTLRRIGVNNYVFVNIEVGDAVKFTVGEEDLNNSHKEMGKIRRTFNKESWLKNAAPYIMYIISMLLLMIVLISLFNKFTVLSDVGKSMDSVAEKQLEITRLLYNITVPTSQPLIIKGGGT